MHVYKHLCLWCGKRRSWTDCGCLEWTGLIKVVVGVIVMVVFVTLAVVAMPVCHRDSVGCCSCSGCGYGVDGSSIIGVVVVVMVVGHDLTDEATTALSFVVVQQ